MRVLILVLVDVGLGPTSMSLFMPGRLSLNPCFSGCWSRTQVVVNRIQRRLHCLNPCFSGCWSRTDYLSLAWHEVGRLNPCFSGCWSRTAHRFRDFIHYGLVLILVLVDVGLGLLTGSVTSFTMD